MERDKPSSKKSRVHIIDDNLLYIRGIMNRSGDDFTRTLNDIITEARVAAHGVNNEKRTNNTITNKSNKNGTKT